MNKYSNIRIQNLLSQTGRKPDKRIAQGIALGMLDGMPMRPEWAEA